MNNWTIRTNEQTNVADNIKEIAAPQSGDSNIFRESSAYGENSWQSLSR